MAGSTYNFKALSILLVDDAKPMADLLGSILKELGVGKITTHADAKRSMDLLDSVAQMQAQGTPAVDIVISDWRMEPISGIDLLKWIRNHQSDGIRFMPFIMLTAYSDHARVMAARDAGANEVLAKPVSVHNLVRRLLSVIENPRPFVSCPTYFGPDRRRKSIPINFPDRRKTSPS
jgi:two-component system, chemotaxis family, chemotaxis protein CheY